MSIHDPPPQSHHLHQIYTPTREVDSSETTLVPPLELLEKHSVTDFSRGCQRDSPDFILGHGPGYSTKSVLPRVPKVDLMSSTIREHPRYYCESARKSINCGSAKLFPRSAYLKSASSFGISVVPCCRSFFLGSRSLSIGLSGEVDIRPWWRTAFSVSWLPTSC